MRGHRGYTCPWLKNGKREKCGKSCREEYCKVHRAKLRNGSQISLPCLNCGIGVRSQIQLCRGCGREKERQRRLKQAKIDKQPILCNLGLVESTPWPSSPPSEHKTRDESPLGVREKPDTYMTNYEFCFGMRDLKITCRIKIHLNNYNNYVLQQWEEEEKVS